MAFKCVVLKFKIWFIFMST